MHASKKHPLSAQNAETVPKSSLPAYPGGHPVTRAFDSFASTITRWAGSPIAFGLAVIVVLTWAVTGPLFHYSDAWQLVINTGTTVVTFLMVFLIQQSQNKDSVAIHLKLNELVAANRAANSELIGIEDISEEDLRKIADAYLALAKKADATKAEKQAVEQSVDEAKSRPGGKAKR
ncbi:low affinity iron permease family protein [Trinickia caryophylli]|uniref:Low affinity Fe/Cu permease n=1 Tax=Trinickia caryophylli TaxID=28094 RepID=A0A1X7CPH4_TRICW|nr:low affinity iron permease family protein [Trinickia caryophylli]PMS11284.1 low affinity iron permease family protein [Trinickia caryophylli]TRX20137.1 low affinity iron permease family protein [Trinickia caryophylli]WQE12512.1 low affinity iron permease family protein [Trinickia caryophylli]SMF00181.1 Low affinity Fe/Cu permease [Trinickia caryophylli]GLU30196.1 hypothetical protein Busp01_00380 [Trinickia caryophylli]